MTLALITGGSRGIGNYLVRGFAQAGYSVVFTATDGFAAEALARDLTEDLTLPDGVSIHGAGLNVADPTSVSTLRKTVLNIEEQTGTKLGVIINNAGVIEMPEGPVWEVPADQLYRTITTNVLGPFYMVREFAPVLLDNVAAGGAGAGRIIDINSGSGSHGSNEYAAYSASKMALFRLADSVHHYGYERGLRIFELAPGVIRSDMTESMPVHDWRTDADWTNPDDVVALALGMASGELDEFSGRFARAGHDTVASLRQAIDAGLDEDFRTLRMTL